MAHSCPSPSSPFLLPSPSPSVSREEDNNNNSISSTTSPRLPTSYSSILLSSSSDPAVPRTRTHTHTHIPTPAVTSLFASASAGVIDLPPPFPFHDQFHELDIAIGIDDIAGNCNNNNIDLPLLLSTNTPPLTPPPPYPHPNIETSPLLLLPHSFAHVHGPAHTLVHSPSPTMTLSILHRPRSAQQQAQQHLLHLRERDTSSSQSPSPSPVSPHLSEYASSNNPSPASHTLSMNSNDGHDTHTSSSSDAPPPSTSNTSSSMRMSSGVGLGSGSGSGSGSGGNAGGAGDQNQQQQLQSTTGKGGCWTCRIRRKKCDEQRTGDSCQTCIRLNIDCLGWGPKRPAWMRDKQAVERHKAAIKDKLSKAGMIRGIPRPPAASASSTSTASGAGGSGAATGSSPAPTSSSGAGAGPSRLGVTAGSSASSSPYYSHYRPRATPYYSPHRPLGTLGAMQVMPSAGGVPAAPAPAAASSAPATSTRGTGILGHETDVDYFHTGMSMHNVQDQYSRTIGMTGGTNSPHSPFTTMNPFAGTTGQLPLRHPTPHLQNVGFPSFTVPTPPPVPSHSTSSMLEGTMFTPTSSTTPVSAATMSPRSNDPLSQKEFVDPHIMYYLNTVLPSQYPIVSESMTSIMHNIMTSEAPHYGAVTHASCALASLHNKSIRVARGLDQPDLDPQYSTASQFYNKAYLLLCPTKTGPTAYTEYDALAALQLVSYWVLFGGAGQWSELLDAARGWIVTTGLPTHENPRLALRELSQVGKLVVKITMWFDVFSSITSMQAPRFMGLYQRLLSTGTNGFWARGEHDVRMDNLMGCTDDVMLAFAEIADLAAWKAHEQITGRLSVRTLVHRGEEIEARLRNGTLAEARVGGTGTPALLEPISAGLVVASNTSPANRQGSNASSTSSSASTPPSITIHPATTTLTTSPETTLTSLPAIDNGRGGLATVFREAACLYLHTVVNESRPGVPEVANAVTALMAAFQSCPPTLTDRMLTLPLCLAGCLASQPIHRDYIDKRLAAQEEAVWNAKMIRIIVARVAAMRSQNATAVVDWRSAIHEYLMHEGLVQESLLV